MENLEVIILILFVITFFSILSNKYKFPFPIVLVLVGLSISFIPGLPVITLKPEIVFLIFLPPLLYSASWYISWHDFKASIRPIGFAGIGLVFFTTFLVGLCAHYFIPGFSWAESFLLGAIVSPPDAVAATSIIKNLGLHPRIISILEGESLVNDASGLIAYKYALAAIMTGGFTLWEAGFQFLLVVTGGIVIGLIIGYVMYLIHKNFICDSTVEVTLTFLTPFASYLLAERFHVSGVLAVVTTGLYLSFRSSEMFTHQSRMKAYAVWDVVIFILNSLVFILLGLQLKYVMNEISNLSTGDLIFYGLVISIVVVIVRFVWFVPATLLARLFNRVRDQEYFDYRYMIVFGWSGMRGVVSMAAALAVPLVFTNNQIFSNRSLIIFLTFCVIIFTLIVQGLSLPWLINKLKLPKFSLLAEEYDVRMQILNNAITHIEENLSLIDQDILAKIKSKYEIKFGRLQKTDLPANFGANGKNISKQLFNQFNQLQLDLINIERGIIKDLHKKGTATQEVLRKIERELDLEEERIAMDF